MDLLALVVIAVFFMMVRPVRGIQDIAYQGGYVYLALGKQGVRVLDVSSNRALPREVGAYDTFGTANALDLGVAGDSTYLYVADGKAGISVFEVGADGSLEFLWSDKTFANAVDISIQGKFALVARGKKGLTVVRVDSGPPGSGVDPGEGYWQVNGIATAQKVIVELNQAYVVDADWRLHVLNINQPQNAQVLQSFPIGVPVNDLKISGRIAYIATEGSGLVLLNLYAPPENAVIGTYSNMRSVQSVSVQGAFAYISGGIAGIHAIEISTPWEIVKVGEFRQVETGEVRPQRPGEADDSKPGGDSIYAGIEAGPILLVGDALYYSDGLDGLRVLHPEQVVDVQNPDTFGAIGLEQGWVEDVAIVNQKGDQGDVDGKTYAYLAGGDRGLWIIDVTNKGAPEDIPFLDSAEGDGFNRLLGYANAVAAYGDYAYVAYKTRGIQIFQVSDPEHPTALTPIGLDGETHDLAIIDDQHLFVAAGSNGLRIIDVEQKVLTSVIGAEDTPGNAVGVFVLDHHAYIADSGSGLQIVNVLDLQKPTLIASGDTPGEARGVTVTKYRTAPDSPLKLYAYVADGSGGVAIFEVTNPQEPRAVKTIESVEFVQDVAIQDGRLYVSERSEGLVIFDLGDPENPVRMGVVDTPGKASRVTVEGEYAYIADHNRGLRIINIANSLDPREYGFFDLPTQVKDLVIAGNGYAYLVDGAAGMWTVSLQNHRNPIPVNFLDTPGEPVGIDLGTDGRIYIADGSKGLHVVDITTNPMNPTILGTYGKLSDVRAVKVRDGFAYVANGRGGFPVLAVSDPGNITQTGYFGTDGYALNVDIAGNYAYIVTTQGKIDIANLGFPGNLPEVKPIPPMNTILADTQNVLVVPNREHAYVSDGNNGLVVFDVNQPYKPVKIFELDTPGKLMDLAVTQHYAFLADGKGGVGLIYMPTSTNFQTNMDWYTPFGRDGEKALNQSCDVNALNIEVIPHIVKQKDSTDRGFEDHPSDQLLRYYAFVATDQCGLQTLEYTILVDLSQGGSYTTPGDATFGMVVKGYWGVLKGTLVGIWNKRSQGDIGFFGMPAAARLIGAAQVQALDPRIKSTAWLYVFGVFLFTVGIFYWMALIAYFILPVRDPKEGWLSFQRLFLYFRGMHGPIVRARNGVEQSVAQDPDRPGVALVDLNSAIAIEEYPAGGMLASLSQTRLLKKRKETGETLYQARAEGPGVVFLRAFERVRGVADLRPQIRLRFQVGTQTRDGIEVESMVFTLFTLGEPAQVLQVTYAGEPSAENVRVITTREVGVPIPGKTGRERLIKVVSALPDDLDQDDKREIHRFIQKYNNNQVDVNPSEKAFDRSQIGPFLFDERRVFDAVVSKPYDVDDQEIKEWTELPAHVAAGIFRNLVNREYYDNLYKPSDQREYPILELKQEFMKVMRNQGVLAYQYVENLDGSPIKEDQVWETSKLKTSPERELHTPKLLRARGIKVIAAGFGELKPTHEDVSQYLTRYWRSEWQREAMIKESEYDLEAMRIKNMARVQAQSNIVKTLSMIMSDSTYSREALAYRTLQALEAAAADPKTRSLLPGETIRMLERIHDLLLSDTTPVLDGGQSGDTQNDVPGDPVGGQPGQSSGSGVILDDPPPAPGEGQGGEVETERLPEDDGDQLLNTADNQPVGAEDVQQPGPEEGQSPGNGEDLDRQSPNPGEDQGVARVDEGKLDDENGPAGNSTGDLPGNTYDDRPPDSEGR